MKKNWVIPLVALIAVVDIVLVYLAFRHTSGTPASASADGVAASTQPQSEGTTSDATSGQTSEQTTGATTQPSAASPEQGAITLVSLASDGTALRATSVRCDEGGNGELEVSTDGGATFQPIEIPQHQILRVIASSNANLQYVGAGEDCDPSLYQSVDGGTTWSEGPADGAWHLAAGALSATVRSPDGPVDAGCEAVSISVLSRTTAAVACADGAARMTTDGGANWQSAGHAQGIVSVSLLNATSGYALAVGSQCPAEVRRTTDAGGSWNPVGCIQGGAPMALDAIGQQVVAIVGGAPHLSTDGGSSWS